VRKGNTIYMTKVPFSPQAHTEAKTKQEKQLAYCHCPWVKAAITANVQVTPLLCYCSAAWNMQLLEGILERKVEAELVECLLRGDDCCTHAYHLPRDS
jgi:predicted ArsR family transcriptional regulator